MSESNELRSLPAGERSVPRASLAPKLPPQSVVSTSVIAITSPALAANSNSSTSPAWSIDPDSRLPQTKGRLGNTVISAVPSASSLLAVIVTVPGATPATTPSSFTVANSLPDVSQANTASGTMVPRASDPLAAS